VEILQASAGGTHFSFSMSGESRRGAT
jgi:hypothetical protein